MQENISRIARFLIPHGAPDAIGTIDKVARSDPTLTPALGQPLEPEQQAKPAVPLCR
jgi:hypothetical protein